MSPEEKIIVTECLGELFLLGNFAALIGTKIISQEEISAQIFRIQHEVMHVLADLVNGKNASAPITTPGYNNNPCYAPVREMNSCQKLGK